MLLFHFFSKLQEGTRFRPSFLEDSEYIPVCLPAFRPDRCIREDGENQEGQNIADNLKKLHKAPEKIVDSSEDQKPEILYHMTTKAEWEKAKVPYFNYVSTFYLFLTNYVPFIVSIFTA